MPFFFFLSRNLFYKIQPMNKYIKYSWTFQDLTNQYFLEITFLLKFELPVNHISNVKLDRNYHFDKRNDLSLRVFRLLSSSLLLFQQRFGRYILRFSSNSETFTELRTTSYSEFTEVTWFDSVTSVKYSCIVTRLRSRLNPQPPDDYLLRSSGSQCL